MTVKCANFMNQEAIDSAVRKYNGDMGESLYQEGANCCDQCEYGLGIETDPIIKLMRDMTGKPIKRICYKAK